MPGRVVIPGSAGVPPAQDLAGSWRLASQGWSVHLPTGAGAAPLQECGRDARAPRGKPMAGQVQIRILQKALLIVDWGVVTTDFASNPKSTVRNSRSAKLDSSVNVVSTRDLEAAGKAWLESNRPLMKILKALFFAPALQKGCPGRSWAGPSQSLLHLPAVIRCPIQSIPGSSCER